MFRNVGNLLNSFDLSLLSNIKLSDVIDIALITYVVYFFLSRIKDTRAWSLFKGIIILVILKRIFWLLQFYAMSLLLDSLFTMGVLALVVLFQPELRKLLEEIGKGKFLLSEQTDTSLSNKEIIKAIKIMANARTGALICIEREVPLGEYEKTGIPIDASITRQLLVNIFEDKTPLHDGAVIVKKDRIAAAGCILPVTSKEIGKELGTRHRAAVGLSEVCDAIILVVSEETGAISMAREGKLIKGIKSDVVYDILQKTMDENNTSRLSKLRRRYDDKNK